MSLTSLPASLDLNFAFTLDIHLLAPVERIFVVGLNSGLPTKLPYRTGSLTVASFYKYLGDTLGPSPPLIHVSEKTDEYTCLVLVGTGLRQSETALKY